jgi:endonuclease/exonuclease/phosphatase family metal-dependent hydrolase
MVLGVPTVRVATFNVENLFARFKFNSGVDPSEAVRDGWDVNETHFEEFSSTDKRITAQAVKKVDPDVIALQEVENVDTLKHFRSLFLGGFNAYPYVAGIDGNDPRLIDVAVLSRLPIVRVRSNQHVRESPQSRSFVFSRDCLEVDVDVDGQVLTLYVNHLKSMLGGRAQTRARRVLQARTVRQIVVDRLGANPGDQPFIVLGDMNDYLETDEDGTTTGIDELVLWDQVVNVVERRDQDERWTHFFKGRAGEEPAYRQLDYLLLSTSLAAANPGTPDIMRMGMPLRADRYTGPRFEWIGEDRPKASDHCPVSIDLNL